MALGRGAIITKIGLAGARNWRKLRRSLATFGLMHVLRMNPKLDVIAFAPAELGTTDPILAEEMIKGRFAFAGHAVLAGQDSIFVAPSPAAAWLEALHSFQWLRHLSASPSDLTQSTARRLVDEWITLYSRHHTLFWRDDMLAKRLMAWLAASPLLLTGADDEFYARFTRSLLTQARHLQSISKVLEPGLPRLMAALALVYVGLSFKNQKKMLKKANEALGRGCSSQISADGGHLSRNPAVVVELLSYALPLQMLYARCGEAMPHVLPKTIERMLSYLRLMRHKDGAIATFNGASSVSQELIATLLAHGEDRPSGAGLTIVGRYARLEAADSLVFVDVGQTPSSLGREAHAGLGAFEMSHGRQRLLVNCGAPALNREQWATALRVTAAHNTLILNDSSSAVLASSGELIPLANQITVKPDAQSCTLTLFHNAYQAVFFATHERSLSLSADGRRLTGFDSIATPKPGLAVDIRFHLHPSVVIFSEEGTEGLILSPPEGPEWLFTSDYAADVEESIFGSGNNGPKRSAQIVLRGKTDTQGFRCGWSLTSLQKQ